MPTAERQKIVLAEQKKWDDQRTRGAAQDRGARSQERRQVQRGGRPDVPPAGARGLSRLSGEPRSIRGKCYDVPRWLNEGLAQTFEAGLLEADTLRIDTPNLVALASLQSDLRGPQPLELTDLLNAGSETFLAAHAGDGQVAVAIVLLLVGTGLLPGVRAGRVRHAAVRRLSQSRRAAVSAVERFETLGRHAARRVSDALARGHACAQADSLSTGDASKRHRTASTSEQAFGLGQLNRRPCRRSLPAAWR